MTLVVKHAFVSGVADDPSSAAAGEVLPSHWDASHALTGTADASQLNGNVVQSVTNDTNVTGSISAQNLTFSWSGQLSPPRGGTGLATYALGDTIYASAANTLAALAGNIAATRKFLRQTGTGTVSAAPAWDTIQAADVPASALTGNNDTNVTLTLGGSPAGALLAATSLTLGWTGTLAASRGGFGADVSAQSGVPLFATGVATFTGTTGNGNFARATSPTFVTPALGAATATSINNVAITAPAASATLTIANTKTLTVNNTLTFAGTDSTTITFQGTDTYVGRATTDTLTNKTLDTAATGNVLKINGTQVSSVTGSGSAIALGTSPVFTTNATSPVLLGGSTASSSLTLQSTSGVGTSDSIALKVGNNGATTALSIDTNGNITAGVTLGIGAASPAAGVPLYIRTGTDHNLEFGNTGTGCQVAVFNNARNTYETFAFAASTITFNGNGNVGLTVDAGNDVVVGSAALATNSTVGFFYIPTCAGAPTGTPTAFTGRYPMIYDSTNHKFWMYDVGASAWKGVVLT